MKEKLRVIPKKNYIILGFILLFTLLLLYYFYMWFDLYEETILNRPILDNYLEVINYNEIDNYIVENPNTIIYVSKLEDNDIREFEKKFKSYIKNKKYINDILYLDITNEIEDNKINNSYSINNLSIYNVPCVLYFKNGNLQEIYSVKNNNYSIDIFTNYVNNIILGDE